MRHIPPSLPALLALLPLLLPAASPAGPLAVHEWDARPADPRPYAGRIPHGSAARLVARLPGPVASASFHWQTNGMGGLWWDAPAECLSNAVSAVWTPAMDTGADEVRAFFRIEQPEGPDYGAFCHLAMLDSPGFVPNALPLPVRTLDFAAVAWTNAPWALPSDIPPAPDLSDYATTSQVADAIAAIPAPDPPDLSPYATWQGLDSATNAVRQGLDSALAPYATTSYVAEAIAEAVPQPDPGGEGEWATNAFCYVTWTPEPAPGQTAEQDWLDARRRVATAAGVIGARLHAWRETRGPDGAAPAEIAGEWSLVSGSQYAALTNDVLHATGESGPAAVRFLGDGGEDLSAVVPMDWALPGQTVIQPCAEQEEWSATWRGIASVNAAVPYIVLASEEPASRYRHSRGGEPDSWCEVPDSLQLYSAAEARNPAAVNTGFFDPSLANLLRCQSAGRTDFYTGPDTRPALFLSAHIAACAAHYTPREATFCLDRAGGGTFRRYAFRQLTGAPGLPADLGDLRLLWSDEAFPTNLLPRLLPAGDLERLSPSRFAAGIGLYQSQHGTVHPCLVWPLTRTGSWAAIHPGAPPLTVDGAPGCNDTWSPDLAPFAHAVHGGDSGHCVFLRIQPYDVDTLVPVGLYHFATGSGESFLSARVQTWLDAEMGRYGEAPLYIPRYVED